MGTFTLETGFGMLLTGLVVMAIMATIGFLIINKIDRDKKEAIEREKRMEKFR